MASSGTTFTSGYSWRHLAPHCESASCTLSARLLIRRVSSPSHGLRRLLVYTGSRPSYVQPPSAVEWSWYSLVVSTTSSTLTSFMPHLSLPPTRSFDLCSVSAFPCSSRPCFVSTIKPREIRHTDVPANLGVNWACTLIAFLALVCAPLPL